MPQPVDVTVVTSPGCHYCVEALRLLDEAAKSSSLRITPVPLSSEKGRTLLARHRVPFPPIVLVDGEFFGYGKISRRKLEAHLTSLVARERTS